MLVITLNTLTGTAKPATSTPIRSGVGVPVKIICENGSPGNNPYFQLAVTTDSTPPEIKAYLDVFTAENDSTFIGVLNANDDRLNTYMAAKASISLNVELYWTIDGPGAGERETQSAPNFKVTVEPSAIQAGAASMAGPNYLTALQIAAAYAPIGDVRIPDRDNNDQLMRMVLKGGQIQFEIVP